MNSEQASKMGLFYLLLIAVAVSLVGLQFVVDRQVDEAAVATWQAQVTPSATRDPDTTHVAATPIVTSETVPAAPDPNANDKLMWLSVAFLLPVIFVLGIFALMFLLG